VRAERLLWLAVISLAALGIVGAVHRAVFLDDAAQRADLVRRDVLNAAGISDRSLDRAADVAAFDSSYAAYPLVTLLHVVPGGLLLLFAPLQFSSRLRARHISWHRWSGRFLLAVAVPTALSGLFFGMWMPFGGRGETAMIVPFALLMLASFARAYRAVRRGDIATHREWMIRAFAVAIAIASVRVVGAVLDVTLSPYVGLRALFVIAIWTGWLTTVFAAEVWIRRSKHVAV
jgi:uncharacterized membrane protein